MYWNKGASIMTSAFDYGDEIAITATFVDADGNAADPTTVTFRVKPNATGTVTNYVYGTDSEVSTTGTGVYKLTITLNQEGVWHWRVEGTGDVVTAEEGSFVVEDSEFY